MKFVSENQRKKVMMKLNSSIGVKKKPEIDDVNGININKSFMVFNEETRREEPGIIFEKTDSDLFVENELKNKMKKVFTNRKDYIDKIQVVFRNYYLYSLDDYDKSIYKWFHGGMNAMSTDKGDFSNHFVLINKSGYTGEYKNYLYPTILHEMLHTLTGGVGDIKEGSVVLLTSLFYDLKDFNDSIPSGYFNYAKGALYDLEYLSHKTGISAQKLIIDSINDKYNDEIDNEYKTNSKYKRLLHEIFVLNRSPEYRKIKKDVIMHTNYTRVGDDFVNILNAFKNNENYFYFKE